MDLRVAVSPPSTFKTGGFPGVYRRSSDPGQFADDRCAVCLNEEFIDTKLLPCHHAFHGDCILRWVEANFSCPLCRRVVEQFVPIEDGQAVTQFDQKGRAIPQYSAAPPREGHRLRRQQSQETFQKFIAIWEKFYLYTPSVAVHSKDIRPQVLTTKDTLIGGLPVTPLPLKDDFVLPPSAATSPLEVQAIPPPIAQNDSEIGFVASSPEPSMHLQPPGLRPSASYPNFATLHDHRSPYMSSIPAHLDYLDCEMRISSIHPHKTPYRSSVDKPADVAEVKTDDVRMPITGLDILRTASAIVEDALQTETSEKSDDREAVFEIREILSQPPKTPGSPHIVVSADPPELKIAEPAVVDHIATPIVTEEPIVEEAEFPLVLEEAVVPAVEAEAVVTIVEAEPIDVPAPSEIKPLKLEELVPLVIKEPTVELKEPAPVVDLPQPSLVLMMNLIEADVVTKTDIIATAVGVPSLVARKAMHTIDHFRKSASGRRAWSQLSQFKTKPAARTKPVAAEVTRSKAASSGGDPMKRTPNHVKAGIIAGGTTALYMQGVQCLEGATLAPLRGILTPAFAVASAPTVAAVATYFTTFELMKNHVFRTDDPSSHLGTKVSSWAAASAVGASAAYVFQRSFIPVRYGIQFGVFELGKYLVAHTGRDSDSPRHLGPAAIMATAAMGGVAASAVMFPAAAFLAHYATIPATNHFSVMGQRYAFELYLGPVAGGAPGGHVAAAGDSLRQGTVRAVTAANTTTVRALYNGWGSALCRFVPACVVTASAYEFALRGVSGRYSK